MIEQTIPSGPVNGAAGPKSTNDALVDSALEALGDLAGPPDNDTAPARKTVPGKRQPQQDAPQAPEGDQDDEESPVGEPDEESDEEAHEPASEDEPEEHDDRGSEDNPFTVKDLPKDKLIEIKVEGEKVKIPLRELADGYIREKVFHQRITQTKQLADEAAAHAQRFQEERTNLREATRSFLSDSDQLFDYFMATEDREQVIMQVAQRLAAQVKKHRENPEERLLYQRQRDMRRLQEERERLHAQAQAEQQQKQQRDAQESFQRIFKPGWEAGLRRAGFPEVIAQGGGFTREGQQLWDEVAVRLQQRQQSGKPITPEDVSEFVYRASKLLELQPRNAGKRPRPAPAAAPRDREAGKRGKDPWANVPKHKKIASPDYFLKNLRPRDFR